MSFKIAPEKLRIYERQAIMQRYPALPFASGIYCPITMDLPKGVKTITQEEYQNVGMAAIIADGAEDLPMVDYALSEKDYKVITIKVAWSYTTEEVEAAEQSNQDIISSRMKTAVQAINETANKFVAFGSKRHGLKGVVNNDLVTVNNSSFNPYTASASDFINFFLDEVRSISTGSGSGTKMTSYPNLALIPGTMMTAMMKNLVPNTSTTVLDHVLTQLNRSRGDNSQFRIREALELDSAVLEANGVHTSGFNKDRIVIMNNDPECLKRRVEAKPIVSLPEFYNGNRYLHPMRHRTSQPINFFPQEMRYITVTKQP